MSRKSEFKENSASKTVNDSVKRAKMSENFSKTVSDVEDSSVSVTIYEDDSDLNYYYRSSKGLILNSSLGKRSPLAIINKGGSGQCAGPSTSSQHHQAPVKTPSKLNESHAERPEPTEDKPDPFQLLSDEVLLHIFSYLPKKALNRLALVNDRFCRVVQDETLWVRIDLGNKLIRRGALSTIISRGLVILRLAQAKLLCPIFEPDFPQNYRSKLQYLDLSMVSIEPQELVVLLRTCRLLKKLSLEFVPVDDDVCLEISENEKIETLNMAMCEGLTAEGLNLMIPRLKLLVALNISWTYIETSAVDVIASCLPDTVMRLNIAGCRKSLLDRHLMKIVERCPNLVEIDASDCTMLTATCVPYLMSLQKLEYLSLSRCYNIPMTSYLTLNSIKTLLYLDVFGLLSDSGLQHMERTFKNIGVNKFIHSSVARPTVTPRRTSLWGLRTRD